MWVTHVQQQSCDTSPLGMQEVNSYIEHLQMGVVIYCGTVGDEPTR